MIFLEFSFWFMVNDDFVNSFLSILLFFSLLISILNIYELLCTNLNGLETIQLPQLKEKFTLNIYIYIQAHFNPISFRIEHKLPKHAPKKKKS